MSKTTEEIIALMEANGESAQKIQEVRERLEKRSIAKEKKVEPAKEVNSETAGKTNDNAIGVFAESEEKTPVMGPVEETEESTDLESVDGSSESQEVNRHDWLNYKSVDGDVKDDVVVSSGTPLFSLDEDDAVAQLTERYRGFEFETSNIGPSIDTEGPGFSINNAFGSYNVVKATRKKANGDIVSKKFKVGYGLDESHEESYNALTSFIDENSNSETDKAQIKAEQENVQAFLDHQAKVKFTEEEEYTLKNKFINDKDLFKPVEEKVVTRLGGSGMDGKFAPTLPTTTKVTQPYEEELNTAIKVLKKLGVENPTKQEVESKAREILLSNSLTEIVENNTVNVLEELESSSETEEPAYSKFLLSNILDLKTNNIPRQKLALGARQFQLQYNAKVTELKAVSLEINEGKEIVKLKSLNSRLSNKDYNFKVVEGEELVKLSSGKVVPARVVDQYNNTLKSYTSKVERGKTLYEDLAGDSYNIESIESQMDLLKRSYNSWEEFTIETGVGLAEMGAQVVYGTTKAFFPIKAPVVDDKMINVSDWANGIRDSYAKDVKFENAFSSIKNFGSFAAQELSNQIPIFAALAAPGGQALLFTSSFGSRYSDMVREDRSLTGEKTSETEKWFQSLGFGATEMVFESLTTLPLIRNAKKAFINSPKGNGLFGDGFKTHFKENAAKSLVYEPLGEAVSEGATTISQNLISGTNLLEGLDHSMFSGLMFGTTLSSTPFMKGLYLSKFSDFETKQNARNKLSEMTELDNLNTSIRKELYELGGSYLGTEQDIADNEERIAELREEYVAEMNKVESKYKTLSPRAAEDLLDAETRMEVLRLDAARVKESSMPDDIKDSKLARIKMEFDQTNAAVEQFKASDTFTNNWTLFQANRKNKSETKRINSLAKLKLSQEGNSDPDAATLSEEARIIYNKEYIKSDLKKSNGENKVVAHETVEETVTYLENDTEAKIANLSKQNLSESKLANETQKLKDDLQEAVYQIKNGANGFMDTNSKGEKISLVNIDNAAKNDRLETRTHEVKHAIFVNALSSDPKAFKGLSDQVLDWTKRNKPDAYKRIISRAERRADGSMLEDEVIAVFFEEVANNRINLETEGNSIFSGLLGFLASEGSKNSANADLNLAGETDAIKFLIGAANKIKAGTLTLKEVKESAIIKEANKAVDTDSVDTGKFSKEDVKPEVDELGSMGWTKDTWKSQGADLAIAEMQANKMLDGLIAAKMKGGLRDGDNETKKDFISKVYSELTAHVKNFNPESNDSLFGWVNSQVSNKAGNVYNREYKDKSLERAVDIDATTSEGAPLVQIEADTDILMEAIDEIGLDETEVEERSRLRRDIRLDDKMMQTVRDAVIKTFGTKLPNVDSKKFRTALEKAFRTELKKPLQDLMGGRSEYDLFLRNHAKAIIKAFPVETLVQMERNLKPEQRIFTESRRITKPTEVDKLISEGKLPKDTNRTSGPQLHTKKSFPGVEKVMAYFRGKDMETVLGYKVGASTLGTRKDKLAMELGVELAFDATAETIQNPEVAEKRQMILELQGIEQLDNELAVIGKQIDRDPSIKFSKNFRLGVGIKNNNKSLFIGKFDEVISQLKGDKALLRDEKAIKAVLKNVYGDDIPTEELTKSAKNIVKYTNEYSKIENKLGPVEFDTTLNQFIMESVEADVLEKGSFQLLSSLMPGDVKTIGSLFKDLGRVKRSRQAFVSFANDLIDKLGEDKALRLILTQYKGMYASASKIGDGSISLVDGVLTLSTEGDFGTNRGQVFANVKDFYKALGLTEGQIKNANTKMFAESSSAGFKDQDYDGRLKQAKEAREAVTLLMDFYMDGIKSGTLDYADLAMLTRMFGSNMNSPMKRAANLAYVAQGLESLPLEKLGSLAEYEHMVPTNVKILEMVKAYVNEGSVNEDFFNDYEVAIIPKTMDKVLIKNGLRDFRPMTYKEGDSNWGRYYNRQTLGSKDLVPLISIKPKDKGKLIGADFVEASKIVLQPNINEKGVQLVGRTMAKYSKSNGMSTFDFDETLIIDGENFITATDPVTGKELKLSSGEWPIKGPGLAADGFEFDFSDFVNVRGGTDGPLLQKMKNQVKKYGNKNVFVLTARMQDAAGPIHGWLKSKGVDIPFKNITGLGDGRGEAKAEWMLDKFAEGYNDMYFVDDAMPNVDAVKKVLDQLDIKSKVVQAKIKFSKEASKDFNDMLERTKGVKSDDVVSGAKAKILGAKKRGTFFVPPSAEDFKGLMYSFLGKGKQGDQDLKWFKENLFDPFSKGVREMDSVKQRMTEEYKSIKSTFPDTIKGLSKKVAGTDFTLDNAIRVYLWNQNNVDIPGLSEKEVNLLSSVIENDPKHKAFAMALSAMSRQESGYSSPSDYWTAETIGSDLSNIVNKVNRADYLAEWIENKDLVFSNDNLNKIEAIYGTSFREALQDILWRMEKGTNRPTGQDANVNKFLNWMNGSVGAVMFFNTRSAVLQTLSTVNFLNFQDNNIFAASKAFANQKQFWSDFAMLYNSDMLKQRRAGLKIDVSASELTEAFSKGKGKSEAAIAYLLQLGFTPTQIADSFAISMGGSTYYRNRVNKYIKEGKSKKDAESQAFLDFQEIAEETQQSSRPDLISQQQSGVLGRIILAWANTPMQMTRLTKKALSDLVNRRGDTKANISRIIYYGVAQNIIFGTLQTGLAFLAFGAEEEEEKTDAKQLRMVNGVFDTLLRGTGIWGAAASTLKNIIMQVHEELGKGFGKRDWSRVSQKMFDLSPPLGTKHRKIMNAIKTYDYNKDVIKKMDHGINNPGWNVFTNVVEGMTNAPIARVLNKAQNLKLAMQANIETWQRVAIGLGWSAWSVGVEDQELLEAKAEVKEDKSKASKERAKAKREAKKLDKQDTSNKEAEDKKKEGYKTLRCISKKSDGSRCSIMVETKAKFAYCNYHKTYDPKKGSDNNGNGIKEYQCSGKTGSGSRCKNRTENKNKKCYAHQ